MNTSNAIANMDLQQLRVFFVLGQVGNYTETARRLFRTQPAVSHAIRKLEDSVGVKLVERKGKNFALTEDGKKLHEACEEAFYALEAASESIARSGKTHGGRIRVGSTVEFGSGVLAQHLGAFAFDHPETDVDLTLERDLLPGLLRDDYDLIVDCKEHNLPELVQDPLFRESYEVVCAPTYRDNLSIETPSDLCRCMVITMDEDGGWWNRFTLSLPPSERPTFGRTMRISHIRAAIIAVVRAGGVALVPKYSVIPELEDGSLVSLFPSIRVLEDRFSIYQKRARSGLKRNVLLTEFLKATKPSEFG